MGDVDGITVTRWKRYGKDRLYANDGAGVRVGWVDLETGDVVIEQAARDRECLAAFGEFAAAQGLTLPEAAMPTMVAPEPSVPTPALPAEQVAAPLTAAAAVTILPGNPTVAPPSPVPTKGAAAPGVPGQRDTEPAWVDLATNRPGQDLAAQAAELRREAPIRTTLARVLGVHTGERAMRIGAKGERLVAARLEGLPDGWHVLHAIHVRRDRDTDVDHVVIGPGGVYCLNTKHHPDAKIVVRGGSFRVNGYRQHYVKASRAEARKASRLLTAACGRAIDVHPLIVVVGAYLDVRQQPADVTVLRRKDVAKWLRKRPAVLTPADVESIYDMARRSTTWLPEAS